MEALIVVDMLRGFLEEGYPLYCGDEARKIIPNVVKQTDIASENGVATIFVCDLHSPDDLEFKMFPPHCVIGTEEAEVIPEFHFRWSHMFEYKSRYSGFYDTNLDRRLKDIGANKLTICGVCTDICVMHTVADARNRDYEVIVPVDCVASFNEEGHRFALDHMEKVLGAKVV